jgi:hypothetical protein
LTKKLKNYNFFAEPERNFPFLYTNFLQKFVFDHFFSYPNFPNVVIIRFVTATFLCRIGQLLAVFCKIMSFCSQCAFGKSAFSADVPFTTIKGKNQRIVQSE